MPWGDGTGPTGMGPMTGRGLGYCVGYGTPGFYSAPGRQAYGVGGGRGRAFAAPGPSYGYGMSPWSGPAFGRGPGRGWFGRGCGRGFGWWRRRSPWW